MDHRSIWEATTTTRPYAGPFRGETTCDVVVVGGGIAGLTAALLLQQANRRVILIEARRIGSGETGRTTAHLTEVLDERYHRLEAKFGRDGAAKAAAASREAIDHIERTCRELDLGCGFARVPGFLYAETESDLDELGRELEAFGRVGTHAARATDLPLPFPVAGIVRIENQARFHPLNYVIGLAEAFRAAGGEIFERTPMRELHDDEPCRVVTPEGTLQAAAVLVMTNVPVSNRFALHTKVAPYRTYALAVRRERGEYPDALFWDLADPYHYIRRQDIADGPCLVVGGEDHKTGKDDAPSERYERLEAYTREHFGEIEILHRWSGQVIEPADGLPFIGHNTGSKHVFVATGFSGTGMTFGTIAGLVLADLALGRKNSYEGLFDATRVKPLAQAGRFLVENVDFPAHLATDRVRRSEVQSAAQIPPGEGALLRVRGRMLAVFRADDGTVHARSAVCPHLGCHVKWNNAEKSWDCPCHGSRFDAGGDVLNGPAVSPLATAELPESEETVYPEA